MNTRFWIVALTGIALLPMGAMVGRHFAVAESGAVSANSLAAQVAKKPILKVATGGANLRVHTAPNSYIFVNCLEDRTPVVIKQYSTDRQWAMVESEWSQAIGWIPNGGWVRTKYLAPQ